MLSINQNIQSTSIPAANVIFTSLGEDYGFKFAAVVAMTVINDS